MQHSHQQDTVSEMSNNLIPSLELQTSKKRAESTVDVQRLLKRIRMIESRSLPHDTICNILSKLPVRSILRFRSVCKSWNLTISDPYFVRLQLNEARSKAPRVIMLQRSKGPQPLKKYGLYALEEETFVPELMMEREFPGESAMLMSIYHCDGLILLYSRDDIYLCNPSTGESLPLPKFAPGVAVNEKTVQFIGFGLDRLTNKYKVVRMFYRYYSERTLEYSVGCEVFTLGTMEYSWRQVDDPPHPPFQEYSASTSGIVYWMNKHFQEDPAIISFDLSSEEFGSIRPPPDAVLAVFPGKRRIRYLMVGYGETLWLLHLHWHPSTTLHIWELVDGPTHSWKKIHAIRWQVLDEAYIPVPVLAICGGKRLMILIDGKTVDCYDIGSEEYKTVFPIQKEGEEEEEEEGGQQQLCRRLLRFNICLYVESLVPLRSTSLASYP